jgi:hypothetical protein
MLDYLLAIIAIGCLLILFLPVGIFIYIKKRKNSNRGYNLNLIYSKSVQFNKSFVFRSTFNKNKIKPKKLGLILKEWDESENNGCQKEYQVEIFLKIEIHMVILQIPYYRTYYIIQLKINLKK